jgi:hypothetical protein
MPRYYFHIKTDNGLIEDDTGLELGKGDLKEIRSAIWSCPCLTGQSAIALGL